MAYPTKVASSKPSHFELAWFSWNGNSNAGFAALTGASPQPPLTQTKAIRESKTPYNDGYSYTYNAVARLTWRFPSKTRQKITKPLRTTLSQRGGGREGGSEWFCEEEESGERSRQAGSSIG